jgi:hypothetical protein
MPTQIFISHITEDAAAATRLKLRLMEDFLDQFTVFQSSDTKVLPQEKIGFHPLTKQYAILPSSLSYAALSPLPVRGSILRQEPPGCEIYP